MSRRLRDEIKQTKPFTSPREEAYLNLQRSAALLEQQLARFFKSWKLTPTQYNVLRILRGAHPEALPCREVGDRMVTPVPDVTRLLSRLEEKEMVRRSRGTTDRRVVLVTVTDSGRELLDEIEGPLRERMKELLGHMEADDLRELSRLLERLRDR
ncbi:MAG: MarR family transcriptional regulator [Thermoanaerobaculia bacterium]|nr:MarR family transcriptional regulator [Thermoanaerobaculia bacterium]